MVNSLNNNQTEDSRDYLDRITNIKSVADLVLAVQNTSTKAHKELANKVSQGAEMREAFEYLANKYANLTQEEVLKERQRIIDEYAADAEKHKERVMQTERERLASQAQPYVPLQELFAQSELAKLKLTLQLHIVGLQAHQTNIAMLNTQLTALQQRQQLHAAQAAAVRQAQITQMTQNLRLAGLGQAPGFVGQNIQMKLRDPNTGEYVAYDADSEEVQALIEAAVPTPADQLMKIIYPQALRDEPISNLHMVDENTLSLTDAELDQSLENNSIPQAPEAPPTSPYLDVVDHDPAVGAFKHNLITHFNLAFGGARFDSLSSNEINFASVINALNQNKQPIRIMVGKNVSNDLIQTFANAIQDVREEVSIKIQLSSEHRGVATKTKVIKALGLGIEALEEDLNARSGLNSRPGFSPRPEFNGNFLRPQPNTRKKAKSDDEEKSHSRVVPRPGRSHT